MVTNFIKKHEWLGIMPKRPTHRFIATYKGHIAGVIVMATPNSFSYLLGKEHKHLEKLISRGACISWSPKNLASALIMFSIHFMVKNTSFRVFTAYSDVEAKELGTIYQACNFTYLGQSYGAKLEYLDPLDKSQKWFSDRQFRKSSQIKRYTKDLNIYWDPSWSNQDKIFWDKIPSSVKNSIKLKQQEHKDRCYRRELLPKHKYAYILGQNKSETKYLKKLFKTNNPKLLNLKYPKIRGPKNYTARNFIQNERINLTQNSKDFRPRPQETNEGPFMTVKEVATMLNVSLWTVYNIIKYDPTFPYTNIGFKKKLVIEREKLNSWMEKRSQKLFFDNNQVLTGKQLLNFKEL